MHRLDDRALFAVAEADPERLLEGERAVLFDEWQRLPLIWDLVRRAVDDGAAPGSFLLTGSASPDPPPTHSGAGRIVSLRMRPLSMSERVDGQTVSLAELLTGSRPRIAGASELGLDDYVEEILASGLPGIRGLKDRARRLQLDGYLDRIVDHEIPDETGTTIRNPAALQRWMVAYAAASSTTTSFEKIRDAASAGHDNPPAKITAQVYRDALTRIWILDEIPAGYRPTTHSTSSGKPPSISWRIRHLPLDCSASTPPHCSPANPPVLPSRATARYSRVWWHSRCGSTPTATRPGSATCARPEADKRST